MIIKESEKDKYIKKAIFFAGIPGAGKTTIINTMFGFDTNLNISVYNAKKVNPDLYIEKKIKGKIDWNKDKERMDKIFSRGAEIRDKNLNNYIKNKLPVVIDGVGRYPWYIKELADDLKKQGYSVYMVFITTSLANALKRNKERNRRVEDSFIKASHNLLKDNYTIYQKYFGNNFYEIENDETPDKKILEKIGRRIMG